MLLPFLRLLPGLLLVILTRVGAESISRVVDCGEHRLEVGEVVTIKGSADFCSWDIKAPVNGKVVAACMKLKVPTSNKCSQASLQATSAEKGTVSFCGRKGYQTIDRMSSSVTFTNVPKPGTKNRFKCDVYVKMPVNSTATCSCGVENASGGTRIVGGFTTDPGQYPWVGGITFKGMKKHFCGLVLLSDTHALTAAHCLEGKKMNKLMIVLAEHDIKDSGDTPRTTRKIVDISFHPDHNPNRVDVGDLAIITFAHPVPLHHYMINPVCLPPANAPDYAGKAAITAGWGALKSSTTDFPTKLQAVEVPVWSNSDCRNSGFGNIIHDDLLCAGLPEGGADACLGDSGGPLTVPEGSQHTLVGTVSFGHYCAIANWPGVYSRISGSTDWIKKTIKTGIQCHN